jgi:hypothetical protein
LRQSRHASGWLNLEALQRLAESELYKVSIRIANHSEVTDDATEIGGRLNQDVLSARTLSDVIDFFTGIALEAEVIEAKFDFVLDNHQNKERIFA